MLYGVTAVDGAAPVLVAPANGATNVPVAGREYLHLAVELALAYWGLTADAVRVYDDRLEVVRPDNTLKTYPLEFTGNDNEFVVENVPLSAGDYVEAQRMTNALQSRVIQIVQDSEGMNFVGTAAL